MNTKIGIVALAFTLVGAFTAPVAPLAQESNLQLARGPNVYAMRMDGCPYYPSPVACRSTQSAGHADTHRA
jgi:hypothetical protein